MYRYHTQDDVERDDKKGDDEKGDNEKGDEKGDEKPHLVFMLVVFMPHPAQFFCKLLMSFKECLLSACSQSNKGPAFYQPTLRVRSTNTCSTLILVARSDTTSRLRTPKEPRRSGFSPRSLRLL